MLMDVAGTSMVRRCWMGKDLPNGSCLYPWGQRWFGYSKLWEVWWGLCSIFLLLFFKLIMPDSPWIFIYFTVCLGRSSNSDTLL